MRTQLKAILTRAETTKDTVEASLDTAQDQDYPNDERVEKLEAELEMFSAIIDAINEFADDYD